MKEYEIILILKSNLGEPKYNEYMEKFQKWVTQDKGQILNIKPWGIRNLPETFKKFTQGYYIECQFTANSLILEKIRKNIKVDENILRDLIVTLDSVQEKAKKKEKEVIQEGR